MKKHIFLRSTVWLTVLVLALYPFECLKCQSGLWPHTKALDSLLGLQKLSIETPGFAVCVVENGKIVYEKQGGAAHIGRRQPINEKTVFNIGSISKQFTVMCIMLLEEAGKLHRSDEIHRYIPELPDYGYKITIQHLIGHQSGLRDYLEILGIQNKTKDSRLTNQKMLEYQHIHKSLNFPPGEDFNYSNTGFMMLAVIVERVSGMSIQQFAARYIFEPLGMKDSYFQEERKNGVNTGTKSYSKKSNKKKYKKDHDYVDALGATGVHTTLKDMVLWDQNFYHNVLGDKNPDLITQMETPDSLNTGISTFYGGGLFIRSGRGFPEIEHTGGWGNFLAQYRRFPTKGISVITATNSPEPSPFVLNDLICKILFPTQKDLEPVYKPLPHDLSVESFKGVYLSDNNWVRKVQTCSTGLCILIGTDKNARKYPIFFQETKENWVLFKDSLNNDVMFYQDQGKIAGFRWATGHYFPYSCNFKKMQSTPITAPKVFKGKYHAPDFGRNIRIKYHRRTKSLTLHPFPFVKYRLKPIVGDIYEIEGQGFIVRFSGNQAIVGDLWNRGFILRQL